MEDVMSEVLKSEGLSQEYDNAFSPEEKVANALKLSKGDYTLDEGVVDFNDLLIPVFVTEE